MSEVEEADYWEPRNAAGTLLGSTAAGAVGFWAAGAFADEPKWVTGSGGGDAAVGAGIGLAAGLVILAVDQGDWKDWIR